METACRANTLVRLLFNYGREDILGRHDEHVRCIEYSYATGGKSSIAQTFQPYQRFESKSIPMLFNQKDAQAGAEKAISLEGPLAVSCSLRKMWHVFFSAIRRRIV